MTLTQVTKAGLHEIALDHVFTIGASGSSAYTFQGEGLNGTVNNPTLYLTRGKTYRFENGSGGHPFRIQSTTGTSGTAYNTGVTGNNTVGTVIVEVQHDAPDVLYYQCTQHSAMNGILYISGALADGGVTTAKLASSAVTTAKIADDAITTAKIGDNQVTADQLADIGVIDNPAKIGDGNIITSKIADSGVTTAKIADTAVTLAKLEHGTSSNDGKFLRANNGADPSFEVVNTDLVADTSPQLGGSLDVSNQDIVTTSNADIDLIPNGTGQIVGGGTSGIKLPVGTTAERVNTEGLLRYNSQTNKPEYYDGNQWIPIETPPTLESINNTNPTSTQIAAGFDLVLTGTFFASGATVKFIGANGTVYTSPTVTINSSTQITARVPTGVTNANEPYDVRVTSSAGSITVLDNAMNVNATPSWTTASGTLATIGDTTSGNHATIAATDPEGQAITYSGTVGGGLSLNSSTGVISGNPTDVTSTTTLSFTATATDAGGAAVNRSFNIIVNPVLDGSTAAKAGTSAADIKSNTGTTTNGVYYIKPSGVSTAYQAYCNMNIGGGIILAAKIDDGRTDYWDWDSNLWTSTTTYDSGSRNTNENPAKLQPAVDFPMNYFYITDNDMSHWVRFDLSSQTTGFHNIWAGQNRNWSVGSTVGTHRSHSTVSTDHDTYFDADTGNFDTPEYNTLMGYDTEDWIKVSSMGNYGSVGSDAKIRIGRGVWSDSGPWDSVHSIQRGLGLRGFNHSSPNSGSYVNNSSSKFQMIFVA